MATLFLVLVVVLVIAGLVFGVVSLLAGDDPGMPPADPDGWARPLPHDRSLHEQDLKEVRFDLALRGYRMSQVDRMLRRTAYDLGYKDEMIAVLEAEVMALRDGRLADADVLRSAREAAANPAAPPAASPTTYVPDASDDSSADSSFDGEADPSPGTEVGGDPDDLEVSGGPADDEDRAADDEAEEQAREGSLRRRGPVSDPDEADGQVSENRAALGADLAPAEVDRPAHA